MEMFGSICTNYVRFIAGYWTRSLRGIYSCFISTKDSTKHAVSAPHSQKCQLVLIQYYVS